MNIVYCCRDMAVSVECDVLRVYADGLNMGDDRINYCPFCGAKIEFKTKELFE